MKIQLQVINAFSIDGQGGNPAGVVLNADQFSNAQKQNIAAAAGFPETAFVSSSTVADVKLDFFTPVKQIAHCGHATIATFSHLKNIGKILADRSSKETIDGCRTILFKDGKAFMEQQAPSFREVVDLDDVLSALRIEAGDLKAGLLPMIVNTGNSFLIVPVRDQATLARIQYDREAVSRISEQFGLIGFYIFTDSHSADATTRMFGPYYGIDEEAATGMAAGPLATYLWQVAGTKKEQFQIEQGRFMHPASPSLIQVDLEISGGKIHRLFAGGGAHVSRKIEIDIP